MQTRQSLLFLSVAALLGLTVAAANTSQRRAPEKLAMPLNSIPLQLGAFTADFESPLREDVLGELTPTEYLSRVYSRGGRKARLFIAYYANQKAGESMHSPKNCLPGGGWEIWAHRSAQVQTPAGPVAINHMSVRRGTDRLAVFYWYQSKNRIIANEYHGKLELIRAALTTGRTSGSIVILTVEETPEAIEEALQISARIIPALNRCLPS